MGLTGNLYLGMKYERQPASSDSFTVTGQLTGFCAGRHHFLHFLAIGKSFYVGGGGRRGGSEGGGGVITVGQLITRKVKSGLNLLLTDGRVNATPH